MIPADAKCKKTIKFGHQIALFSHRNSPKIAKSNSAFWRLLRRVMGSEKRPSDVENQALSNETGIRTSKRVLGFDVPKMRFQVLKPVSLERV